MKKLTVLAAIITASALSFTATAAAPIEEFYCAELETAIAEDNYEQLMQISVDIGTDFKQHLYDYNKTSVIYKMNRHSKSTKFNTDFGNALFAACNRDQLIFNRLESFIVNY